MKINKSIFLPAMVVTLIGLAYVCYNRIYLNSTRVMQENNGNFHQERSALGIGIDYDIIEKEMVALIKNKNYEDVIDHYSKYISIDNKHAGFFNTYGVACVKLDKFETAYYAFKRAFLLDFDDLVVFYNLISMAYRTERYSIAHGLSEIYITLTKDDPKYFKQRRLIKEVFNSTKRKSDEPSPSKKSHMKTMV